VRENQAVSLERGWSGGLLDLGIRPGKVPRRARLARDRLTHENTRVRAPRRRRLKAERLGIFFSRLVVPAYGVYQMGAV
jgi:hypothetical protein